MGEDRLGRPIRSPLAREALLPLILTVRRQLPAHALHLAPMIIEDA